MEPAGRVAILTGGGGGIGGALAEQLAAAGSRVLVTDIDGAAAGRVVAAIDAAGGSALSVEADATNAEEIGRLIRLAEQNFGEVDLFFANAGIVGGGGISDEDDWAAAVDLNLLAHVRAARLLVPAWLRRGEGYFFSTASAAGLLSQIGHAPYAVTKHAAVAFAEWLAITYGQRGIRVSCLCPMGVATNMLSSAMAGEDGDLGARVVAAAGEILSPEDVAGQVLEAIEAEQFLVLPHPEVLEFYRRKARDYDRWLAGMQRLQGRVEGS